MALKFGDCNEPGQIYAGLKSLGTPLSVFNGLAVNAGSSSVPATRGNCKNPAPGPTDPVGGDKVDNEDYARHQTDHFLNRHWPLEAAYFCIFPVLESSFNFAAIRSWVSRMIFLMSANVVVGSLLYPISR